MVISRRPAAALVMSDTVTSLMGTDWTSLTVPVRDRD
jgi:hypothetical protein